jgi:hypothetical protein
MTRNAKLGIGAIVGLAIAAFLAFGVFGIHTAFIDDEVSEANPFANVDTDMALAFDDMEEQMESGEIVVEERVETTAAVAAMPDMPESDMADEEATAAPVVPEIRTIATNNGVLVDHGHQGDGTANVITDGTRTFLRFEDDFDIDNGPDLNVYLVRGVDADGPAGAFDDDFIDLGDLKGNVGAQNYEIPEGVDISEYDTVVIWCVRFGVAFNAANLA